MDTKPPKGTFHWRREESASRCGQYLTHLTAQGAYSNPSTCGSWACPDCIKIRIKEIINLLIENITGPHIFVSEIGLTKKELSKWIYKNKPKVPISFYFAFQLQSGNTFLISSHRFPIEYKRHSRVRFLKNLRAHILKHHKEIDRTSHSDIAPSPETEENREPHVLAILPENLNKEWEYKSLKTDREKAEWLYENRGRVNLTNLGRQFMREHLGDQTL